MAAYNVSYIRARARQLNLDPRAVLAVASQEGLSGGVGDGGHAFGPFQLNDAGGVLTGRPGNHRAFAESQAGIDFALQRIARVAAGLRGDAAIQAIVSRFERPANPRKEIAGAERAYGGGSLPSSGPSAMMPAGAMSGGTGGSAGAGPSARMAFVRSLIAQNQAAQEGAPDLAGVVRATLAYHAANMQQPSAAPSLGSFGGPAAPSQTPGAPRADIRELFYDPAGFYFKNGQRIKGAIGGHSDHVHVATQTAAEMVRAITQAQRMGLSVAENPYVGVVHRVHVKDSNHYKVLGRVNGREVGGAVDVAGSPQKMAAYYRWAAKAL